MILTSCFDQLKIGILLSIVKNSAMWRRQQEAEHSFKETPEGTKSGSFFRKGASFQWLRELTPEQA